VRKSNGVQSVRIRIVMDAIAELFERERATLAGVAPES
jgi:hypothetical protein